MPITRLTPSATPGRRYRPGAFADKIRDLPEPIPPVPPIPWYALPGPTGRVIRAPGRIVLFPSDAFATGVYPYGGRELGRVTTCVLQPIGDMYVVEYESLGETGDVLEAPQRYVFSCIVRGWDDQSIEDLMPDSHEIGDVTQHRTMIVPGEHVPGSGLLGNESVVLAFIPDDTINVPGVVLYAAIPQITETYDFQRSKELGLPLAFECLSDTSGRIIAVGRIEDLPL